MFHRIVSNVQLHRLTRHYGDSMKTLCSSCHVFLHGDFFSVNISHGYCEACVKRLYPDLYREEDFADVRREIIERKILEAA